MYCLWFLCWFDEKYACMQQFFGIFLMIHLQQIMVFSVTYTRFVEHPCKEGPVTTNLVCVMAKCVISTKHQHTLSRSFDVGTGVKLAQLWRIGKPWVTNGFQTNFAHSTQLNLTHMVATKVWPTFSYKFHTRVYHNNSRRNVTSIDCHPSPFANASNLLTLIIFLQDHYIR